MTILRKFWWGQYPLPVAFWGFFIGGWFGCVLIGWTLILFEVLVFPSFRPIALMVYAFLFFGYPFWAALGVWRSATVYPPPRFWAYAAKGWVVLSLFAIAQQIARGRLQVLLGIL